jgi:hypothetical protein
MHSGYDQSIEKTLKRSNQSRLDLVICSGGNKYVLRVLRHLLTFFVTCFILVDDRLKDSLARVTEDKAREK